MKIRDAKWALRWRLARDMSKVAPPQVEDDDDAEDYTDLHGYTDHQRIAHEMLYGPGGKRARS